MGRSDGHDPAAAPDVRDVPAAHQVGMVEQVPRQGLPTGPRPRPVRRWHGRPVVGEGRRFPERHGSPPVCSTISGTTGVAATTVVLTMKARRWSGVTRAV